MEKLSGRTEMTETLHPAEQKRLAEIGRQIDALREMLTATTTPDVVAPPADWFAFLSEIKQIQGNASIGLAFVTTLMARDFLVRRFSLPSFDAAAKLQGAAGLDIDAVTVDGARVIAEIKATVPNQGKLLGANQRQEWRKDFDKLNQARADYKFFFVADAAAFNIMRERYAQAVPGLIVVLLTTGEEFVCPPSSIPGSTSSD